MYSAAAYDCLAYSNHTSQVWSDPEGLQPPAKVRSHAKDSKLQTSSIGAAGSCRFNVAYVAISTCTHVETIS